MWERWDLVVILIFAHYYRRNAGAPIHVCARDFFFQSQHDVQRRFARSTIDKYLLASLDYG